MWSDGRLYYGNWKDGQQHGEGTMFESNMNMTKKYYENGKPKQTLELSEVEKQAIINQISNLQKQVKTAVREKKRHSRQSMQAAR